MLYDNPKLECGVSRTVGDVIARGVSQYGKGKFLNIEKYC